MHRVIFILLIGLFSTISQAAAKDWYQARIPVNSRTEAERQHNFTQALTQVLTKLSGQKQSSLPVESVESLINQFYYQSQAEQLWLVVNFDAHSIQQWAQQHGLALWSAARPTVLVWIILTSTQPTLLNEEHHTEAVALLKKQAQQRGISLLLPLMTLEELALLRQFNPLTPPSESLIHQIQKRYGLKTILIAYLNSKADWFLWLDEMQNHWQQPQQSLQQHLSQGLDNAIEQIAQHFAHSTPPTPVEIKVIGIPSLKAYTQLIEYLGNLDIITELQLLALQPEAIQVQLTVKGGAVALNQALSFEDRLLPVSQTNTERVYRWLP